MAKLFQYFLILISLVSVVPSLVDSANASFCIFNCDAVILRDKLQAHVDCLENQIMMGVPGRTNYGTEDLDSEGKVVSIGGAEYTEEELRNEWKENPDKHSSNCYFIADITPQEVEKVYRDSLK